MRQIAALFIGLILSSYAQAKGGGDPYAVKITPPAQVKFVSFEKCSQTLEIELIGEEGADYFYVSPEEAQASLPSFSMETLKDFPNSVLNKVYQLEKEISFHPMPFIEARRKKSTTCKH